MASRPIRCERAGHSFTTRIGEPARARGCTLPARSCATELQLLWAAHPRVQVKAELQFQWFCAVRRVRLDGGDVDRPGFALDGEHWFVANDARRLSPSVERQSICTRAYAQSNGQ